MSDYDGRCRCGQVKLSLSRPPLLTMACHCTGCQRMTGSAFSLSVAVPQEGFNVTEGVPVIGGLHGSLAHYFCPNCMSWMFTRPPGVDFVNVRTTMLDDPRPFAPFIETYTSEKLPWATTPARHHYARFPPVESYQTLMDEFSRQWEASAP